MGLRSWLRARGGHASPRADARSAAPSRASRAHDPDAPDSEIAPGCPASTWEEVPAYLPVDPAEHRAACVIAATIAAGDRPESKMRLKGIAIANPEYRLVACIATAIGAGALEQSSFTVKRIYRHTSQEDAHAA